MLDEDSLILQESRCMIHLGEKISLQLQQLLVY